MSSASEYTQSITSSLGSAIQQLQSAKTIHELRSIKANLLGKSSLIAQAGAQMKGLDAEGKKQLGQCINAFRGSIEEEVTSLTQAISQQEVIAKMEAEHIDITLPPRIAVAGSISPITQVTNQLVNILQDIGFIRVEGPEIESDALNFELLNFPKNHPARQMHDTFFVNTVGAPAATDTQPQAAQEVPYLLRTHTSSAQIRSMLSTSPPLAIISTGKTYRHDSDKTHSPMFHQLEALYIGPRQYSRQEGVLTPTISGLKWLISYLLEGFFMPDMPKIRFRPSFFPFTEPSAEVDIDFGDGWLEVMGCGIVHPNVLKNCDIDASANMGFAFGIGIERLAMLKYGISDLRSLFASRSSYIDSQNITHISASF